MIRSAAFIISVLDISCCALAVIGGGLEKNAGFVFHLFYVSFLVSDQGHQWVLEMADVAGFVEAAGARFNQLELIGRGSFGDVYKA